MILFAAIVIPSDDEFIAPTTFVESVGTKFSWVTVIVFAVMFPPSIVVAPAVTQSITLNEPNIDTCPAPICVATESVASCNFNISPNKSDKSLFAVDNSIDIVSGVNKFKSIDMIDVIIFKSNISSIIRIRVSKPRDSKL